MPGNQSYDNAIQEFKQYGLPDWLRSFLKHEIVIGVVFLAFTHQRPDATGRYVYMYRLDLLKLVSLGFVFFHRSRKVVSYFASSRATRSSSMVDKLL